MTHPSKRKGSSFELEVVRLLQQHGIAAEKVPLSGAVKGGSFACDAKVSVPVLGRDLDVECKRRKRSFGTIDTLLAGNDALFVRDDRCRPMVVMTVEMFAALAKGKPAPIPGAAAKVMRSLVDADFKNGSREVSNILWKAWPSEGGE